MTSVAVKPLVIRLMTEEDIDERVALLTDAKVQRNLLHTGALVPATELRAKHSGWIEAEEPQRLMYRVGTQAGDLIGFTWLTSIDWTSQSCELSIALIPERRGRYGMLTLIHMYEYLYATLNMRVVTNQILSANTMLVRAETRAQRAQVVSPDDSYTTGGFRTSYRWTQTRRDNDAFILCRVERGTRIRERIAAAATPRS